MSPASPVCGEEVFEEQYHPGANYVDLFGKGIIQKVNDADVVNQPQEDDDLSSDRSSSAGSGNVASHQPTTKLGSSQNNNEPSSRESVDVDRELGISN